VYCQNPDCFRERREIERPKETHRVDGVVRRVGRCGHCKKVQASLEWPEEVLDQRFESMKRQIMSAESRAFKQFGAGAWDEIIKGLDVALKDAKEKRSELQKRLGCGLSEAG